MFHCSKILIILLSICALYNCINLPNANYMICGIDLKYGVQDAIKNPIFDQFTYQDGRTIIIQDIVYNIPDQLMVLDYPSEQQTSVNEVYTTQQYVEEATAESYSVGFNSWYSPGMFSYSKQSLYFNEEYTMEGNYTAASSLRITTYKAGFDSEARLNDLFEYELNMLPNVYNNETRDQFYNFFDKYGTVWAKEAIFGGTEEMTTSFSISVLEEETVSVVEKQLNLQFTLLSYSSA